MFELAIIRKYLVPRRKQLSVALIATMSVAVISLVVWLVVVFLSVTDGIEKTWLNKLTSLNAPLKITPSKEYFSSYYYLVDSISASSNFEPKSLGQKQLALKSDPYSPTSDREVPRDWPGPERWADGSLKDPVKIAFAILESLKKKREGLAFQDFELSGAMLRLQIEREYSTTLLTQASYLTSFADHSPYVKSLLLAPPLPKLSPKDKEIFLAKSLQDNGAKVGDRGYLSYPAATPSGVQEQRVPIYVAGFYDPGVMSVGNKCLLVPHAVAHSINTASQMQYFDKTESSGIQVWFKNVYDAGQVKEELVDAFRKAGIDQYWKVTTYKEYDFAKDLLQQFQSDKYLFSLIGIIILMVACCNIISLLVLLVNDKKREIGILQAMGATPKSIALIFGGCGIAMGLLSSLVGIGAALLTLAHLDSLVYFLSFIQGHDAFNSVFYGSSLPNQISGDALRFVLIATPVLALLAGLVPAIKACRLKPSEILRSQ